MTLITAPHKLNPETDLPANLGLLNDDFDKIVSDIGSLSPRVFTLTTQVSAVLTPGQHFIWILDFVDIPGYNDFATLMPLLNFYIDSFDSIHQWPDGPALSGAQKNFQIDYALNITPSSRTYPSLAPYTKTIGTLTVTAENTDSSNHTVYLQDSGAVFSTVTAGVYR
jgi:hypothetical protein